MIVLVDDPASQRRRLLPKHGPSSPQHHADTNRRHCRTRASVPCTSAPRRPPAVRQSLENYGRGSWRSSLWRGRRSRDADRTLGKVVPRGILFGVL